MIVQGWRANYVAYYFPLFYCESFLYTHMYVYVYINVCNVFVAGVRVGAKLPKSFKSENERAD